MFKIIPALMVLCSAVVSVAQTANPPAPKQEEMSLADRARAARKGKETATSAKGAVYTNDNLAQRRKLSFAELDLERDNSDEITQAMIAFKRSHTPGETETAIREWYEQHDSQLMSIMTERKQITEMQQTGYRNSSRSFPRNGGNYREIYAEMQRRELSAQDAYIRVNELGIKVGRLQQGLIKIRNGIQRENLRYDWFKILNGNGYGSF